MVATAIAIYKLRKSLREYSRKTRGIISSLANRVQSLEVSDDKMKQNNQKIKEQV